MMLQRLMSIRAAFVVMAAILAALPAAAGEEKQDYSALPWALRDHYVFSFDQDRAQFLYATDNGEWTIHFEGLGEFIDKARASITLGDDTVVQLADFDRGAADRERADTPMGPCSDFRSDFPERDGLKVLHRVSVQNDYPFLVVRMEITNTGEAPVEIKQLSPVIFGPGCMKDASGKMESAIRRLDMRAGYATFDRTAKSSLAFFRDPTNNRTLALGVLPLHIARSGINLEPFEGAWQGEIVSVFDPPIQLEPGASLAADPVFLTFSVPKPEDVETYFTWTRSKLPCPVALADAPRFWCTVDDGAGAEALYTEAAKWAASGLKHALVPATWESRPGALEGARPRYPKSMQSVASSLGAAGMTPGITVDPLATLEGGETFAASMAGHTWLNLSHPDGRSQAIANMRKVVGWGFQFFVIQKSTVPDEVLRAFNMTRAQADALAHEVMTEAAGSLSVFPSAATTLQDGLDDWLEASGCTSRLWEYQIAAAPVRFDVSGLRELSDEMGSALAFFGGPIELIGTPHRNLASQIAGIKRRTAQPLDIMQRAPRTWLVPSDESGSGEKTQMTFSAPAS